MRLRRFLVSNAFLSEILRGNMRSASATNVPPDLTIMSVGFSEEYPDTTEVIASSQMFDDIDQVEIEPKDIPLHNVVYSSGVIYDPELGA